MKLFYKISLSLFTLLLIIIIGFAITFNPNDYKDDIIKIVKNETGRELSISGDISLSLFPWIGIDLGAIEISNAEGFSKQHFAKMAHLQVRAKLWPLFMQKIVADTLVIEGLNLNLSKNKNGISNWDDVTKRKIQAKINQKTKTETKTKKNTNTRHHTAIPKNETNIKNEKLNWQH